MQYYILEESKMQPKKLPLIEKISYAFVNIGNIPIMTLVSSFLSIFYVTVLGMDEFKVGTLFLVARVFDGVNDPLIGYFIDRRPNSKFGKFRRVLIFGTVICVLNYVLLWFGPAYASEGMKLIIAYISYLLLGVTFPIMDISLNSMLPLMSDDLKERNVLSSIKSIGYGLGGGICSILAPVFISAMDSTREAYLIVIGGFTAMALVFSIGGTLGIKQNVQFDDSKNYQIKDIFKIVTAKPVLLTFLASLFYNAGYNFVTTSNSYYAEFVLGDLSKLTLLTVFSAVGSVPIILVAPKLTEKFGKKLVYGLGMALVGAGCLVKVIAVDSSTLGHVVACVSSVIIGVGSSFAMILNYGIQADNIDYIEYKMDKRSEGAVSALSSMITKIAMGIGGAIPLYILGATKAADGSYSTMGLAISEAVLPCVFCVAAGLLFIAKYPITAGKLESMHKELVERRSEK